jgi:hypothetical protein
MDQREIFGMQAYHPFIVGAGEHRGGRLDTGGKAVGGYRRIAQYAFAQGQDRFAQPRAEGVEHLRIHAAECGLDAMAGGIGSSRFGRAELCPASAPSA